MLRASPGLMVYYFFEWFILQIVQLIVKPKPAIRPEENVQGKVVVITGANTGLGKQAAHEMANRGAIVVMGCRNQTEGERVMHEIREKTGSHTVVLMELDLSDMSSIRKFASKVQQAYPEIKILINNAGISLDCNHLKKTKDGFEMHIGVNHLGHFLLTNLLLENLKRTPASRVVTVSSTTLVMTNFDLDDIMMERTSLGIGNTMPYNNSKFANALFAKELAKRLEGTEVASYSVCPGLAKTQVFRHYSAIGQMLVGCALNTIGLSTEKAADILLYAALSTDASLKSGGMYRFSKRCSTIEKLFADDLARSLWEKSEVLVGLK